MFESLPTNPSGTSSPRLLDKTLRAYHADWRDFETWCQTVGVEPLPASPDILCLYLADRSQSYKLSTLRRRMCAIHHSHVSAGQASPTNSPMVVAVWQGVQKMNKTPTVRKAPVTFETVERMVQVQPDSLMGMRNRALLLLGYAGGLGRSDIVCLNFEDVNIAEDGMLLSLHRKEQQSGGTSRPLFILRGDDPQTCPVMALESWLRDSTITGGALFRAVNRHGQIQSGRLGDRTVALIVKAAAEAIGLDSGQFSGQSLRSGFIASLTEAGVPEPVIMLRAGYRATQSARHHR